VQELWREQKRSRNVVRSIRSNEIDFLLTDPERLDACDLQTMSKDDVPKDLRAQGAAQRDGYLDGFCVFFTVKFDDDNAFSTFPDCKPTRWSTPNFRVERRAVRKGDALDLRMKFDDIQSMDSWSIEVTGQ